MDPNNASSITPIAAAPRATSGNIEDAAKESAPEISKNIRLLIYPNQYHPMTHQNLIFSCELPLGDIFPAAPAAMLPQQPSAINPCLADVNALPAAHPIPIKSTNAQ